MSIASKELLKGFEKIFVDVATGKINKGVMEADIDDLKKGGEFTIKVTVQKITGH